MTVVVGSVFSLSLSLSLSQFHLVNDSKSLEERNRKGERYSERDQLEINIHSGRVRERRDPNWAMMFERRGEL